MRSSATHLPRRRRRAAGEGKRARQTEPRGSHHQGQIGTPIMLEAELLRLLERVGIDGRGKLGSVGILLWMSRPFLELVGLGCIGVDPLLVRPHEGLVELARHVSL